MIQVTRAVEVITRVVRSALRRSCIITSRFRIREALIVAHDMLLRQLVGTVTAEVILEKIAPITLVAAVVEHDVGDHFRLTGMQRCNQLTQLLLRPPVALLIAILLGGIAHTATGRTGAWREPYQIEVGIDSRCVLQEVHPPGTTVFGSGRIAVITIPVESL